MSFISARATLSYLVKRMLACANHLQQFGYGRSANWASSGE